VVRPEDPFVILRARYNVILVGGIPGGGLFALLGLPATCRPPATAPHRPPARMRLVCAWGLGSDQPGRVKLKFVLRSKPRRLRNFKVSK